MANIKKYTTKNGEKRYYFRLYLGLDPLTGKKKQTTRRGFRTQKEAKIEISKLQLQLAKNGELKRKNKITFNELYSEFTESYKNSVRSSSMKTFKYKASRHILPYLGDMIVSSMTPKVMQSYVNDLSKRLNKFGIVYRCVKRILNFGYRRGYIDSNPLNFIILPKEKQNKTKSNFYTREELSIFLNLSYFKNHKMELTFFRLIAFSGIRKGEALALKWNDVDFINNVININKTLSTSTYKNQVINPPKTEAGYRKILVDTKTIAILREWNILQKKIMLSKGSNYNTSNQFVFSRMPNKTYDVDMTNYWLKNAYKNSNIKHITVHGFRHTHASMLFSSGVNIKAIQKRLGHSTPEVTMNVYTHFSQKQTNDEIKKLTKYVNF